MSLCATYYGTAVADPRVEHDPAAAYLVAERGRALAAACDPAFATVLLAHDGLLSALDGTIDGGERCDATRAMLPEYFAALASCEQPDQVCHVLDAAPTCVDLSPDGAPCRLGPECASGRCVGTGILFLGGTCGPGLAEGMACTWVWDCASYVCAGSPARCQPATAEGVFCRSG
jgi:hypothetical protein